jgi:hypothetical protein
MKIFRARIVALSFIWVTTVTFLNMSFFVAEVAALKSEYNKEVLENIARLVSSSLAEEETDSEVPGSGHALKETDLLEGQWYHLCFEAAGISNLLKVFGDNHGTHRGYYTIITPPPDFRI